MRRALIEESLLADRDSTRLPANGTRCVEALSVDVLAAVEVVFPGHDRTASPVLGDRQELLPIPPAAERHAIGRPSGRHGPRGGEVLGEDLESAGTIVEPDEEGAATAVGSEGGHSGGFRDSSQELIPACGAYGAPTCPPPGRSEGVEALGVDVFVTAPRILPDGDEPAVRVGDERRVHLVTR